MRSINLYLEYILIFIISFYAINFIYNYYENNKYHFSMLVLDREEETNIKLLDSYFRNLLNFYSFSEFLNLKINGKCINNYVIFYKSSDCIPSILNITYSGDIINNDGFYFIYSNLTNLYYLVFKRTSISFEGCYENKYSYIIKTSFCDGMCIKNCNIHIRKNKEDIEIYIK